MDLARIVHITISLIVGFIALIFSTQIVGKLQLSQGTPFHFISAIVLGELLGNAVYDKEIGIGMILYTVGLWTALIYSIEFITQKFRRTRGFFEGTPSILVRNGQIDFKALKKNRMDLNELQRLLREKDIFSVREVQYGILEPGGSISVLKKPQYDYPTREDFNLLDKMVSLPTTLILDGEILYENLNEIGQNENWLINQLKIQGIDKVKDVIFADWTPQEGIHIVKREGIF
jgi:uncharacterized membrane protein YcaP (DUF421 family)